VTKYGTGNVKGFNTPSELTREEQRQFAALSSMGLTKKTWSSYQTAERMLAKCCKEKGLRFEWPTSEALITKFILWLAYDRNLSGASINTYLAGIRQAHVSKGMPCPNIRTERISLLLKGKANIDREEKQRNPKERRQAVTPDILRLAKTRINETDLQLVDKRMLWSVATALFFGAFRGIEILCREAGQFDPAYTLCTEDVRVVGKQGEEEKLQFRLKAPKEKRNGGDTVVDVFKADSDICPVAAFVKWKQLGPVWEQGRPAFRWSSGKPLTSAMFNKILKERLAGYVAGAEKWFTTHSFRTGAASMMAALGYADEDIKSMGRWSSRAFETYIRLPRTKRIEMARTFARSRI
jgi:Phage integrase SAM-like domain